MADLQDYFGEFREQVIGNDDHIDSPYGSKKIVYADWIASGRLYSPIEKRLSQEIGAFVANTHTESNTTGSMMTNAYHHARKMIKEHVGALESDVLVSTNSGMTGVVNKFQRILGLKLHESFRDKVQIKQEDRPVVFISHMEHHSNQTSWLETIAQVEIISACPEGKSDLESLRSLLEKYKDRKRKIAAITSCSNVTGVFTPYHQMAKLMHAYGGYCFVDFACSAPYIDINMHPDDPEEALDAIYFSPHKFLGGPGSSGILIFNPVLYKNKIPDDPGGGTVDWTNPWGEHKYLDQIEAREDGGTPAFLQTIKVALCIQLKTEIGVDKMLQREKEIMNLVWPRLKSIHNLRLLADNITQRLCIFSFYIDDLHYNLGVKLLNDRYGIQVRGGCSCAGTYGHYLLEVSYEKSKIIANSISQGILTSKPGWIRLSIHPIMTDAEINYILDAIEELSTHHQEWAKEYNYDTGKNEFFHKTFVDSMMYLDQWFSGMSNILV